MYGDRYRLNPNIFVVMLEHGGNFFSSFEIRLTEPGHMTESREQTVNLKGLRRLGRVTQVR